ncbi:MAG: penicillin-binding transpeptidase domain-containing protein [Kofleriaceae bacterium]
MTPRKPRATPRIKPMTPGISHAARLRAYLVGAVMTAGLVGVAFRAWALQVDDNGRYRELAARQHGQSVHIPAPRGEVLDARGRSLAVSADADSIWANPREIHDVTETAAKIAQLTGGEAAALEAKLGGDRRFVWIARHVSPEVARAVREAKLPGIQVDREPRRWYPARTIGGPVVGRADIDGKGLDGIELAMNTLLTGRRGEGTAVRNARGQRMYADGLAQPMPGATVKLTLDRSIQAIADDALAQAITTHQAKSGVVVVLDVATSRVLALASHPTYDPNTGEGIVHGARNRTITDVFEAGSVMKMFTIAAALDEGVVKPDSWFDVQGGSMQVGPKRIRDVHHDKYLTTSGIIKRSSNVGTVKVAFQLGRERLYAALQRFGFGKKTGSELPGEQGGRLRPGSKWREIELATISFGYGLTATPLQIAAALAALGNRGVYHAPRIVDEVVDPTGAVVYRGTSEGRQVVKPAAADALRVMMGTVFEGGKDGGTAHSLVVPGFRSAGKSGTAHKWDAAARKYADKRYLSSFAGLAPLRDPRLAIVVIIDEPSGGDYFGGKVAGPVFATVASESLRYLGVPGESLQCPPPTPGIDPRTQVIPPKVCTIPAPRPTANGKPLPPPAPIEEPEPEPEPAPPPEVEDGTTMIPDFRGMGVGRAMEIARKANVVVEIRGGGRVIEQDPAPGPADASARVILRFSDGDSAAPRAVPAVP